MSWKLIAHHGRPDAPRRRTENVGRSQRIRPTLIGTFPRLHPRDHILMRDDAASIGCPNPLVYRCQLPFLHSDEILHRLLDHLGLRPIKSCSNRGYALVQARVQADADRRGFAHF